MANIIDYLEGIYGAHTEKVDPNTQAIRNKKAHPTADLLAQAAIPAVLVGYYRNTRHLEGAEVPAINVIHDNPLQLFGNKSDIVVQRVADYANVSKAEAEEAMSVIGRAIPGFLSKELGESPSASKIQNYFGLHRQAILKRLPEDLQLGEILGDSSLDDRTNKMEGPISRLAQAIQELFSSPNDKKKTW